MPCRSATPSEACFGQRPARTTTTRCAQLVVNLDGMSIPDVLATFRVDYPWTHEEEDAVPLGVLRTFQATSKTQGVLSFKTLLTLYSVI